MFRRLCTALAASALIAGLLGPTWALADDSFIPTCSPGSASVNEDDVVNDNVTCSDSEPGDQYEIVSDASDGAVSVNADTGSYTYTPDGDFNGSDSFSYRMTDPDGNADPAIVDITVDPVNDVPSFTKGPNKSVPENDGATSVAWATSISEGPPDESSQTVSFIVTNNNSSLFSADPAVSPSGVLSFTPATGQNGSASVSVRIKDNGGTSPGVDTSAAQSFTIDVTSSNDPPSFTKGANQTALEDAGPRTVPGWVTASSPGPPDESGQHVTFVIDSVTSSSHFSAGPAVSSGGTLTYTPATDANGVSTVTLHAHDDGGGTTDDSPTQTFTITLTAVNDRPSFNPGADQSVAENAGAKSISGWATGVDRGAPDESGQSVSYIVDGNSNAALFSAPPAVSSTGTLTYTVAANKSGTATITLHIHDNGGVTNGGIDDGADETFTVSVASVNDPPSFVKGSDQTNLEDAGARTVSGWATSISAGPSDESSQVVTFVVANDNIALFSAQPAVSSGGTLTYTPALNANGSATVTLHAHDNGGGSADSPSQTFTITVSAVNDPPSFAKGADRIDDENAGPQTVSGWATSILEGPPNEVSSQTLSFTVTNNNTALFTAQPSISPSGTLTYTPGASKNGSATVSVQLFDSGGVANSGDNSSVIATFTITVAAINDAPTFTKGADQTDPEDSGAQSVPGWATAISAGPPDEATQTLTFVVVSNNKPSLFSVLPSIGATGDLAYSPAPNANGTATIVIELHDNGTTVNGGHDTSATQTFHINVTPQNDAPTCVNATAATFVDAALNSTLTTCADIDLDTLHYAVVAAPSHGTATVNVNGSFTYTPNVTYQGNDVFSFKANDGTVDSNVVTMSILVSPDPIAKNDVAPTDFPANVQGSGPTAIPVLANDQDKQGGPLLITSVTQGSKGTVAITGGGTGLTYDPTGLATGTDSFRYTITDDQARTNSATVVVVISPAAPTGARPIATIVTPGTLGTTTTKVRVTWATTNAGTGLKSYRLQESYNGGPFKSLGLVTAKSTSSLRTFTFGKSYRYRLKVTDSAGNVSPWAISPTFVAGRSQETSVGIAYTGSWVLASSASYSGGKARWANAAGASATFSFSGEGVAWVSSKGPTRGTAQVLIDGVLAKTVSLFASKMTARQVVFRAAWPTIGLHTIQIVVVGTAGHPRVDVDTFVLAK